MTSTRLALLAPALVVLAACTPSGDAAAADTPTRHTASCTVVDGRADTTCTPGAINPQVTQLNIASTICRKGWTATVRPPTSYTSPLERDLMARYSETGTPSDYELDHLIPLELGGAPRDPANLYPQPYTGSHGARVKDVEENSLRRAVCAGRMKLADARAAILRDWTHP